MVFSIIVPAYNAEQYIENTLIDTLNQSFYSFEIIIVDDGSADMSASICDACANKYPNQVIVIHQKNQGQLAARCKGIMLAKGEYCMFLDADDSYMEEALHYLQNVIEKNNNPDMIIFPFYYDRNGKLELSKLIDKEESIYVGERLDKIYNAFFCGTLMNAVWSKCVKRAVALESIKGFEKYAALRCAEDRYQSMRMMQYVNSVVYIPEPFYRYSIVEGSISHQYSLESIEKFNTSTLYSYELNCFNEWIGLDSESKERFDVQWCIYPIYILDLFWFNSRINREKLLRYSWERLLPVEITRTMIFNNHCLDEKYKKLWEWIFSSHYHFIKKYFYKKSIIKTLRRQRKWYI